MNKAFRTGLSLVLLVAFSSCDATKKTTATPKVKKEKVVKGKETKEKVVKAPKPKKERRKKGAAPDTVVVLVPPDTSNAGRVVIAVPAGPISGEALAGATILAKRATQVPAFKTFSGKARMRYEAGDDSKEFSAVIRIDSGKAIWVSVSALGGLVNVARLYLTPDSLRLLNFLQRQVMERPYAESAALLPVALSFHDLEAFLLGYAPAASAGGTVTRFAPVEGGVSLTEHSTANWDYGLDYRSTDSALTQFTALSGDAGKPFNLAVLLSEYALNGGHMFAQKRVASWTAGEKTGKLFMDWDAPEWDKELLMPFSVPKSYERK